MTAQEVSGRRETGKQARREALLDVARAILEEGDLSMRQLADRAGVAHATPYNLFGSKRDLLAALYLSQRQRLETRLATMALDPLAGLLMAIELIADDLAQQPHFHRALYRAIYRADAGVPSEPAPNDPGVDFWIAQVGAAEAAGCFRSGARVDLFQRCVVNLITGAMLDWTEHRVDAQAWGVGVRYGIALLSLPLVEAPARAQLETIINSPAQRDQRPPVAGSPA